MISALRLFSRQPPCRHVFLSIEMCASYNGGWGNGGFRGSGQNSRGDSYGKRKYGGRGGGGRGRGRGGGRGGGQRDFDEEGGNSDRPPPGLKGKEIGMKNCLSVRTSVQLYILFLEPLSSVYLSNLIR